ncbi:hypothetical protein HMPREF0373_02948, partial [Eubacterium ramulus ATCC 29099]
PLRKICYYSPFAEMGVSTRTEIKNATRQYKNTVVWRKGLLAENPQITLVFIF